MKTDVVFQLEGAPWPALLVTLAGVVEDTNPAAQAFFGDRLAAKEFSALGDGETAGSGFLALCTQLATPVMPLKFRGRDGNVMTFNTAISPLNLSGTRYFLFQLYPLTLAGGNTSFRTADVRGASVEINAVQ